MDSGRQATRLAAIVAADISGYTRLMAEDESGTHAAFMAHRVELIEPSIGKFDGRIVKNTGDGFLCEFQSVTKATQFSIDVQNEMARRNAELPEERRIKFRIGINVGDVIVERDDIYGTGVNTTVGLERLAEPGGICVAASVHDEVSNKLAIQFEDLGVRKLGKHSDPVHAYRIVNGGLNQRDKLKRWLRRVHVSGPIVTMSVVAFIATASLLWHAYRGAPTASTGVDSVDALPLPLPDKPSIAVLPFENIGGDPKQEYLSNGVTEDIITDLSRIAGLFVIAKNSSFRYKGQPVDLRRIGRELGVRYLLQGSVRKGGGKVRINAQLADTVTGRQLWAERYDSAANTVLDMQDKITRKIVSALAVNLTRAEGARIGYVGTYNPAAHDAYLRGWEYYRRWTANDFALALSSFKEAAALDPIFAEAHAAIASIYLIARVRHWHRQLGLSSAYEAEARARVTLPKAMVRPTPLAHRVAARFLNFEDRHDEALAEIERAIALDPNDAENYALLSITLTWSGRPQQGIAAMRTAMRLNPHYPPKYQVYVGVAKYGMNDFSAAAHYLERSLRRNPESALALTHLVAAYGQIGRIDDVAPKLITLNKIRRQNGVPLFSIWMARNASFYKRKADLDRLIDGLRKAKVPEKIRFSQAMR